MDTHDARAAMASNAASGTISFSSEVYGVLKFDPVGVGIGGSGECHCGVEPSRGCAALFLRIVVANRLQPA